jgi:glycosyltransferase involved in cell wall biosynthesis
MIKDKMKVVAVIPAYYVALAMAGIVKKTLEYWDDVVVVDDCSTDDTIGVIKELGVKYLRHTKNQGQGASTRDGIAMALTLNPDIIITLDGDGQHNPDQIPSLLATLGSRDVDMVIGSRFISNADIPHYRKCGIGIITWFYNVGHRIKVTDSLLCFRAFKRHVLDGFTIKDNGFGFCMEMMIRARYGGFRIKEVPINCIYHKEYALNSTLDPIRLALILVCKTILWRAKIEYGIGNGRSRVYREVSSKRTAQQISGYKNKSNR